jgi:hypothetical protein
MEFIIRSNSKQEFETAINDFIAADNPIHNFGAIIYKPAVKQDELLAIIPEQLADQLSAHQLAFLMSIY